MSAIERKLMAHYIDSSTSSTPAYERLGKDLEELNIEMNAQVETKNNILGETSTKIGSYQPTADVEPFYAEEGSGMYTRLQGIIEERKVLDDLKTTVIEVHTWVPEPVEGSTPTGAYLAYRENAVIEVKSYGGDTSGYQIPFAIHHTGNRVKGYFNPSTKSFVADTDSDDEDDN